MAESVSHLCFRNLAAVYPTSGSDDADCAADSSDAADSIAADAAFDAAAESRAADAASAADVDVRRRLGDLVVVRFRLPQ